MAAVRAYVATRRRVDGLCPKCHNPALKEWDLTQMDMSGLTVVGTRVGCRDCKVWTAPLAPAGGGA